MNLLAIICSLRGIHQFKLPPGPGSVTVNIKTLHCWVCKKDFLDAVAEMQDVSREQAKRYFMDPILLQGYLGTGGRG